MSQENKLQILKNTISSNTYYDWSTKKLWLQNIDKFSTAEIDELITHLESTSRISTQNTTTDQSATIGLLEVLGNLYGGQNLQKLANLFSESDQEFNPQEWQDLMEEISHDQQKATMFFAAIGPDGLEEITKLIFEEQQNRQFLNTEEFHSTISALSGMKQLIQKANNEYLESMRTIFLQETERKQIAEQSSIDRADDLINNFLKNY